ncbi:MAG: tetratricopeptide repeat protein [Chloroflexota bacterium]|nr:tetratricopeptide repeat protein [Chloroflexota bacterium]
MTPASPIVAVVPFGARGGDRRAGAWARQIARRLVERFIDAGPAAGIELRPVFMVTIPEAGDEAGYLVFGSTPDPDLAAGYGSSVGASHVLTGMYFHDDDAPVLEATLVAVATKESVSTERIDARQLRAVEPALASWVARALHIETQADVAGAAAADDVAYAALLEAMDEEVNATLLRASDRERSAAAMDRALARHLDALRADPECRAAEQRLLVLAAESVEHGDERRHIASLEALTEIGRRSWRTHYMLGELRRAVGDRSGAILAFEHSDALRPLQGADQVRLAQMYIEAGAPGSAAARLRRIEADSDDYAIARSLLGALAAQRGDIDAATARYREALGAGAPNAIRLSVARALILGGREAEAREELSSLLAREPTGETTAVARRLLLGLASPDLERELETAGRAAIEGDEAALPRATVSLQRIVAAQPDLWEAHFGLGLLARRAGDVETAEGDFRRALELWPDQPDALHELGVALLQAGRVDEARRLLESAAELRPDDAGYVADAGFAQLRAGELAAARSRLDQAQRLDPDDRITAAYRGELERIEAEVARGRQ